MHFTNAIGRNNERVDVGDGATDADGSDNGACVLGTTKRLCASLDTITCSKVSDGNTGSRGNNEDYNGNAEMSKFA